MFDFPEDIQHFLGYIQPKKTTISASLAYNLLSNGQVLVFSGYPDRIIWVAKELIKLIKYMETLYGEASLISNTNTESYYYSSMYYKSDDIIPAGTPFFALLAVDDKVEIKNALPVNYDSNSASTKRT